MSKGLFKTDLEKGCVLVIGGAKSGKSRIALDMCKGLEKKKIFLATAQALDEEMKERIERHRKGRGGDWITIEEPLRFAETIRELDRPNTVILLDCLTLWMSNLFMKYGDSLQSVEESIKGLIEQLINIKGIIILVNNEVGMGIVPENETARKYRDTAGSLNQRIAALACKVVVVIAGMPVLLKDE